MDIPAKEYVDLIVEFLERVGYDEPTTSHEERAQSLRYVFRGTREHFERPPTADAATDRQYLESIVRTITRMTVFGWERIQPDTLLKLGIYFTYVILEDDPKGELPQAGPDPMKSFVLDLVRGEDQVHPRYRSLFSFFPDLLLCYGKFQQLTMLKSTLELIQGFWIEARDFGGLPGASDYPMFLRRLNGLGDFSGAALFPSADFDETTQFEGIVTVIAQMEPVVALVNDLFSFYKESGTEATCLVNGIRTTEGVDSRQALRTVTDRSVEAVQILEKVVGDQPSKAIADTVYGFIRGYIRWHLSDERYRMDELEVHREDEGANGEKFRRFRRIACHAGCVDVVDYHAL